MSLCRAAPSTPCSKSEIKRVVVGEVEFGPLNQLASAFNREDKTKEKEVLLAHKTQPAIDETDDLLDLDWSGGHKTETIAEQPKTEKKIPAPQHADDDLFGMDIIEETKPVQKNQAAEDLDLFGDDEVRYESPNKSPNAVPQNDDLMLFDDDIAPMQSPPKHTPPEEQPKPQQPIQSTSMANPYAFLDNIHALDTLRSMQNNIALANNDDDDFVESDVTYSEPTKVHAFESSDLIIQYSSRQVR